LDTYRNELSALLRRLGQERSQLRHDAMRAVGGDRSVAVVETPEGALDPATANTEEFLALSLLNTEEQLLTECQAALERIERGTFGFCERCRQPIARERLKTIPYARHCVPCVRELEAASG
jgi:DnaK suppressor protein